MKAKEWIELHQTNNPKEYIDQVFKLHEECLDIARARRNGKTDVDTSNPAPMINALREGAVKWEAVRHGVQVKLGEDAAIFPLVEGGILLTIMNSMSHPGDTQAIWLWLDTRSQRRS